MSQGQRNVLLIVAGVALLELSFTGRLKSLIALATGKKPPITGKAKESPPEARRGGGTGRLINELRG